MSPATLEWLKTAHIIGVILWIAGLSTVYWILRIHATAPTEMSERLTLMERSLALSMELGAAIAIGAGLVSALARTPNLFATPGSGWFHIKLTLVVLAILPVHGLIRARSKKFAMGKVSPVPQWLWSLLLSGGTGIVIMVVRGPRSSRRRFPWPRP